MAYLATTPTIELPSWADGSWDTATLDGKLVPGLVSVEPSRGAKYDEKEAPGQSGAKVTFKGFQSAKVKIVVRMWTRTQETAFETDILPLIDPMPGKESPKGMPFIHPAAAKRKVDGILVEDVAGPKVDDDAQFVEYTIAAFEYRKPAPQQSSPGKPGQTPCQQFKAQYDYAVGVHANAVRFLNNTSISDGPELYAQRQSDAANAELEVQRYAELLSSNKCGETNPGVEAGARGGEGGGVPAP